MSKAPSRRASPDRQKRLRSGHHRRISSQVPMFDVVSQSSACSSSGSSTAGSDSSSEDSCTGNNNTPMIDSSEDLLVENKRTKLYAVGVADTGNGLTEEMLQSAKMMISTSTSGTSTHGAQNTGFGLYHAHLQTKALESQLYLAKLDDCASFLNDDMRGAVLVRKAHVNSGKKKKGPGPGTVLYFTIPVYEDCDGADSALRLKRRVTREAQRMADMTEYSFRPQPSPVSRSGCFRVLVADDVLMLRKGVVHTIGKLWTQKYPHCPVAVSTACTAEDMLRAVESEAYDLIISDHHFNHDESKIQRMDPSVAERPCLRFDESNANMTDSRNDVRSFFANERFTTASDDGSLLGMDALIQLATSKSLRFPTPLLMLVSGHKVEVDRSLGIVVVSFVSSVLYVRPVW
jgi:CheY-like chemotaxis protein